jgi:hypothetical protein
MARKGQRATGGQVRPDREAILMPRVCKDWLDWLAHLPVFCRGLALGGGAFHAGPRCESRPDCPQARDRRNRKKMTT